MTNSTVWNKLSSTVSSIAKKSSFVASTIMAASCGLSGLVLSPNANAASIAVFGNNSIDNFLNTQTGGLHTATLVSDSDLATPGFLNAFDAFLYTRDGASFGTGLSSSASANVQSFVTGNVVLFMTDLADKIGATAVDGEDPLANLALLNAVNFVTQNGKGYIGEFNGAGLALSNNTSGSFNGQALGLVPGTFESLGFSVTEPFDILQTTHPVAVGLPDPWASSGGQHFLAASSSGIPAQFIVANGPAGSANALPTIVANTADVPEPASTLGLLALGAMGATSALKRKKGQNTQDNNLN